MPLALAVELAATLLFLAVELADVPLGLAVEFATMLETYNVRRRRQRPKVSRGWKTGQFICGFGGAAVLWSCQRIDVCDSVRPLYLLTYWVL